MGENDLQSSARMTREPGLQRRISTMAKLGYHAVLQQAALGQCITQLMQARFQNPAAVVRSMRSV